MIKTGRDAPGTPHFLRSHDLHLTQESVPGWHPTPPHATPRAGWRPTGQMAPSFSNGLKVGGTKEVLVRRLLDAGCTPPHPNAQVTLSSTQGYISFLPKPGRAILQLPSIAGVSSKLAIVR